MKPERSEIIIEDGIKYQVDYYAGGGIIKYPWVDPDIPQPEPEPMPEPEPTEFEIIEDALTTLYEEILSLKGVE